MKKYIFCSLFVIGILFSMTTATYATSCPFSDSTVIVSDGRAINYTLKINGGRDENDNIICPTGFGTQEGQIEVFINDIPVNISSWGLQSILVDVPSSVEGLANVRVEGKNGNTNTYTTNSQLLVSLKIDSYPTQIILGEPIELTGNFVNTAGSDDINGNNWPGKVSNLTVDGPNTRLGLTSWTKNKIIVSTTGFGSYRIGVSSFEVYYGDPAAYNGFRSKKFNIDIKPPVCTSDFWSCGEWSTCSMGGTQGRVCQKNEYSNGMYCEGGVLEPETSRTCTPSCTSDTWSCGDWGTCSASGTQTRSCNKTYDCPTATTPSPLTSRSCKPPHPSCTLDEWSCGEWDSCSLSGIQSRSCTKTFDCPNVQTAPPITDQYCEPPNRPTPQRPPNGTDEILNQDSIIKSSVKLLCPVDAQRASQGSGTVIDPSGIILTNKHVVAGTLGCLVGFINDFNDEPYFGERQIADIFKVSSNQDVAILKIRNPQNKRLTSIDITKGNSNLRLGTEITIYGYPAKFGTKITYTSGDFSGTDGSYLKTTAILEYGNSGGGAYLKDGTFIGIPSAVVKGELNALGYILSISAVNSWLGNSSITYDGTSNNTYSRVSVLEDIDLKKLNSLKLFIPETDAKGDLSVPTTNQNTQNLKEQPQPSQTQGESIVIESTDANQKTNPEQNSLISSEKGNNSSIKVSEQRRSIVANAVQEMIKVAERNSGVGQEIKVIAQTQTQNQEKLETGIQKIQSRSGFSKFFIGPNYGEIKNSQKLLEQSKEQIKKLDQLRTQIVNQGDQLQIVEQIQLLEQANQQIENSLNETQRGFSLFGWMFRLFIK